MNTLPLYQQRLESSDRSLVVFAIIQLLHMEKHRNVDISMKLLDWGENDRLRRVFKWVEEEFRFESSSDRSK